MTKYPVTKHPVTKHPVTNCPEAQGIWYGLRMRGEQAFKDFKSTGWQSQRIHVGDPEHANAWLITVWTYS